MKVQLSKRRAFRFYARAWAHVGMTGLRKGLPISMASVLPSLLNQIQVGFWFGRTLLLYVGVLTQFHRYSEVGAHSPLKPNLGVSYFAKVPQRDRS